MAYGRSVARFHPVFVAIVAVACVLPAAASADFTVPAPPITAGVVSVDGISINGQPGNTAVVAPGADVQITATVTDHDTAHPSVIYYVNSGFRGATTSAGCFNDPGLRLDLPNRATDSATVDLGNAPT